MRPSLISSSMRAFLMALFGVIGVAIGAILSLILIGVIISDDDSLEKKTYYKPFVIPNATGTRKVLESSTPIILKVNIEGPIGTELLSMHTIRQQLIESREGTFEDDRVKALLLHINSPGGTVIDSDTIYHLVKGYKKQFNIPVYAYVDGLCASGGMYIAAAADKIYCSDVSLIGSIGVLSPPFLNISKTINQLGIEAVTLSKGKGKDNMNPFRPWKPGEEENYEEILSYYYKSFVDIITENRPKIDREELINDYGAKMFPADAAKTIGLVDETGESLYTTIEKIADDLDLDDDEYQVVQMQSKIWYSKLLTQGPFEMLFNLKQQYMMPNWPFTEKNPFLYLYIP